MAENKPTNRERLREITDGIEQGIKELFESEKYMRYLSVMSRFHRYSVNNTMLIYMQKPDATLVAGPINNSQTPLGEIFTEKGIKPTLIIDAACHPSILKEAVVFLLSERGEPTTRAKQVLTGKKISG